MIGVIRAYRIARKRYQKKGDKWYLRKWMSFFYLLYNCHISYVTEIGEGTELGYGGMGVVIHNKCKIGRNCVIAQNVTLGGIDNLPGQRRKAVRQVNDMELEVPIVEDSVKIGAGAVLLGGIIIGKHSAIGANAVVVDDVEPYSVVAGVPAKKIRMIK